MNGCRWSARDRSGDRPIRAAQSMSGLCNAEVGCGGGSRFAAHAIIGIAHPKKPVAT